MIDMFTFKIAFGLSGVLGSYLAIKVNDANLNALAEWGAVGFLVAFLLFIVRTLWNHNKDKDEKIEKLNQETKDSLKKALENSNQSNQELIKSTGDLNETIKELKKD